jgi:predicted DNA binding CopG/RHH family protein
MKYLSVKVPLSQEDIDKIKERVEFENISLGRYIAKLIKRAEVGSCNMKTP